MVSIVQKLSARQLADRTGRSAVLNAKGDAPCVGNFGRCSIQNGVLTLSSPGWQGDRSVAKHGKARVQVLALRASVHVAM